MPEKKLTYNRTYNPCDDCLHSFTKNNQEGSMCKICEFNQSLDLINRQKAEIERLEKENTILSQNADTAFQDGLNEAQDLYAEQVKAEIKSEAYKEFAERIKIRFAGTLQCSSWVIQKAVDNILKELVGEDDE